eukprot:CAMPEP_0203963162 /NCGR_PEP_ID=MMETSP0359-20131031/93182_1 /ASSEMBLY_ACC=CAM_ASM_000338 /TAXON_ID=268821 /ORGANISM="Scrippsiella Hangoei, Strain SHTV-5" /LENGTH=52 /DNA_ID=CAMNT_0050898857 /DNA_START=31 /DNA_END=186 /DNA_ORIENTATION=-
MAHKEAPTQIWHKGQGVEDLASQSRIAARDEKAKATLKNARLRQPELRRTLV